MATLKMRYGGNIVSLPEGANFSPGNYGTARLKYRVNSSSVGELGLTTNTNAKEYCGLQMRVGGQICFIGRVSTTSYVSGNSVDYHGSSTGSRSQVVSTSSEYLTSLATKPIDYHSSSMSTSTSMYTEVTSTEKIETRSYTQQVQSRTETATKGAGSGNGQSDTQPSIRTVTNNTGSTVTTRTVENKVLTNSSYKETYVLSKAYSVDRFATDNAWNYGIAQRTYATWITSVRQTYTVDYTVWNQHATKGTVSEQIKTVDVRTVKLTVTSSTVLKARSKTSSTSSLVASNYTQKTTSTATLQTVNVSNAATRAAMTKTTHSYTTRTVEYRGQNANSTTYGSYSTNYSYWWTSCSKYTNSYYSTSTVREYSTRSYTGTTYRSSITRSTTSVSETIHNMNV